MRGFPLIHIFFAALVDHAAAIEDNRVFSLHTEALDKAQNR